MFCWFSDKRGLGELCSSSTVTVVSSKKHLTDKCFRFRVRVGSNVVCLSGFLSAPMQSLQFVRCRVCESLSLGLYKFVFAILLSSTFGSH